MSAGPFGTESIVISDYERIADSDLVGVASDESHIIWLGIGDFYKGYRVLEIDAANKHVVLKGPDGKRVLPLKRSTNDSTLPIRLEDLKKFFSSDRKEIFELDVWKRFGRPTSSWPFRRSPSGQLRSTTQQPTHSGRALEQEQVPSWKWRAAWRAERIVQFFGSWKKGLL